MKILNETFLMALQAVLSYNRQEEEKSFLECSPNDGHILIEILTCQAFLGDISISKELATELVKLDGLPFIIMCADLDQPNWLELSVKERNQLPYTEVDSDDLNDGEFPSEWEDFCIQLKD